MCSVALNAADGHTLQAHVSRSALPARAGLIVIQEIFGVNAHIRAVADGYAKDGYLTIAPSLFDRIRPGIELGYTPEDMATGFGHKTTVGNDQPLLDVAAAVGWLQEQGMQKIGIVGYCWGGLLSWLAATRVNGLSASVPYYGGGMPDFKNEQPKCPVLAHFAEQDQWIPQEGVQAFRAAQPSVEMHLYPAHHGFNCDQRGAWEPESARLARQRTLAFFAKHLG